MEESKKRVEEQNVKQAKRDEKLDREFQAKSRPQARRRPTRRAFPASDPVSVKITK